MACLPTNKEALSCQPSAPFLHPALDEEMLQPEKQHKKHRALVQKLIFKKVQTPSWCTSYDPTYTAASSAQPPSPLRGSYRGTKCEAGLKTVEAC